jgi:hypothetical protein
VLKVVFGLLSLCALSLPVCAQKMQRYQSNPAWPPRLRLPCRRRPPWLFSKGLKSSSHSILSPHSTQAGGPGGASSPITIPRTSTPKGSLLCSDPALLNNCGYEKADKLGVYKLNLQCSDGFYDPIWGGSCWKCPDGFIRSANNVQNDDACWRVPPETTAAAQRVKNTPWAWECPSGTFWDIYDRGALLAMPG